MKPKARKLTPVQEAKLREELALAFFLKTLPDNHHLHAVTQLKGERMEHSFRLADAFILKRKEGTVEAAEDCKCNDKNTVPKEAQTKVIPNVYKIPKAGTTITRNRTGKAIIAIIIVALMLYSLVILIGAAFKAVF